MQSLTTIGLPVFNEARHIARTLDSLLAQDYLNLEVVVSDNASTDGTEEICRAYATRDPRVRYHRQPVNVGSSLNFNHTLALARGEYFKWSGGHDTPHPELVSTCVRVLQSKPTLALCYTRATWEGGEDASGSVDTREEPDPFVRLGRVLWGISGGAVYGVFRTATLRRTLGFERTVAPDVQLLAELAVLGRFAYLAEPALVMRRTADFGDWGVYVRKIYGEEPGSLLYWRALLRLCARTGRHFRGRGKLLAYAHTATAFWSRFRWMREELKAIPLARVVNRDGVYLRDV